MARKMVGGKWQKTAERETSKRTAPKPVERGKSKRHIPTPRHGKGR